MTNKHKAIIEKHVSAMMEELGTSDTPPCWFPDGAEQILTTAISAVLEFGQGTYDYLEKNEILTSPDNQKQ